MQSIEQSAPATKHVDSSPLADAHARRDDERKKHARTALEWAHAVNTLCQANEALASTMDYQSKRRAVAFVEASKRTVHAAYVRLEEAAARLNAADLAIVELKCVLSPATESTS